MSLPEFQRLHSIEDFRDLEQLAREIWEEHYIPIIGAEQVSYMMKKFQGAELMHRQSEEEHYHFYFVVLEGTRVGYLSYRMDPDQLFTSKFYLKREARGKGLARAMLRFLEGKARQAGRKSIGLTVNKNNTGSIAAYKAIGFEVVEPVVIDIGGGFVMDDFRMSKSLSHSSL